MECFRRLKSEYRKPGSTVGEELRRRGIQSYVRSDAMDAFYSESDAFLFESAVWNRNRLKSQMRRWVRLRLDAIREVNGGTELDVLVMGDGPGFDSLEIARAGHCVTYHELAGFQEAFAQRLFKSCGQPVRIMTDRNEIPKESFDAVVCLDVLEHVDDPPSVVRSLTEYLRPHGVFFVHAPFYMIHPAYPTHLLPNRRYSGDLALYSDAGLDLLDGQIGWNPLMFAKNSVTSTFRSLRAGSFRLLGIRLAGLVLTLGRWSAIPFAPVHRLRIARGRWFGKERIGCSS